MKKLVLMSRHWVKVAASKTVGKLDDFASGLFYRGVPTMTFMPPARSPHDDRYLQMYGMREDAYRRAMGAQAGAMGGLGGQLLAQLMGGRAAYATKPPSLQEGKVNVSVKLTRIDKEHILVEVECLRHIVHNAKELRELTAKLIETHAEEFLFGEMAKRDIRATADPVTRDPRGPEGEDKEGPREKLEEASKR